MTGQLTRSAAEIGTTTVPSTAAGKQRMLSLDVFRGFTILGMVFVNSILGRNYPGLGHTAWNGWGFADLIFPFFVFIVGVAIPYSFAKRLARGESRLQNHADSHAELFCISSNSLPGCRGKAPVGCIFAMSNQANALLSVLEYKG